MNGEMKTTTRLITLLEDTRSETLKYFELSDPDLDRTYGPCKWPVRFLLHHLTDSETVFYDRICRVLSEPRQVLWVYDEHAWAKGLDYARKPLQLARPVYESLRRTSFIWPHCITNRKGISNSFTASPACEC
jgi:hypothetical protein